MLWSFPLGHREPQGVYSAKDFVYHYNQLPPFSSQNFSIGKRVAIVGMGNVMVDIARWLLLDASEKTAEEAIVVARRGPFDAKFDLKEFVYIENFLDRAAFQQGETLFSRSGQALRRYSFVDSFCSC